MPLMVLGPLDTGTDPLSPRERVILAALIVRRGRGVAPADLADALWGEHPPATWEQQVRNAIARIRSRLGREAVETIGWEYRLVVDPESIDAVRFERLISAARQHALHAEHDRSVDVYRKALALWRGPPLPEVASWEPGSAEAARLRELRTSAEEELLDARLRAGEDRAVIPEAEQLVREDPLREDRWAILALANYRANRQADALVVLRAARTRLDEELGVEPGPRLAELETAILRHDPMLDSPLAPPRVSVSCPYPGLVPFGPDDEESFFGRDSDIQAVLSRLRAGTITAIAGPSGCGKSSLLLAGVIPELRRRGRSVEVMRPGFGGVPALARLLRPEAGLDVLAIDQAEELLGAAEADIDAFCAQVGSFLARGGTAVLTVRSDFLDRIGALPRIGQALGRGIHLITGLDQAGLRSAIEEPARLTGLRLEPGLVELVLRDAAGRPAVLPHLSHALVETWVRREGMTLTVDGYEAAGGIAGAIARSAESAYQSMSFEEQVVCRSLMLRLIERDAAGASIRRRPPAAPLLEEPLRRRVLEQLVSSRLVARDGDAVVVGHEAVAEAWPRLDAWLHEDAEGARLMSAIVTGAELWDAGGRRTDDLLRGGRLQSVTDWRAASGPDLTPIERQYLEASAAAHQSELGHERHQNRRLRWALLGAASLMVLAVVAGGLAVFQSQGAAAAAENQRIEALAATSLSLRASDRDVAALLAAELQRRWPDDPRSRSALLGSIVGAGGLVSKLVFVDGVRASGTLIPDTRTVLMITDRRTGDGTNDADASGAAIIDIDTWTVIDEFEIALPDTAFARDVVVSGDGRIALVQSGQYADPDDPQTCCVNWLTFIDLTSGEVLGGSQLLNLRTGAFPLLSHDGDRMFNVHSVTGDLIEVDSHSGVVRANIAQPPEAFIGMNGERSGISFAADGQLLVGAPGEVVVYDPVTVLPTRRIPVEAGYTESLVLDDDGGGLLLAGSAGLARVDAITGAAMWQRPGERCSEAELTEMGTVLCNDGAGTIVERSLASGEATGREYANLSDWISSSAIIPGASEFVSFAGRDRAAVYRWRIDDEPSVTTPIAQGLTAADGFGDHSGLIIAADSQSDDLTPSRLWDVAADAAVGDSAEWMSWVSDSVVWRSISTGGSVLEDVRTGRQYAVERPEGDTADFYVHSGGLGARAFVIEEHRMMPIDPSTGEMTDTVVEIADVDLLSVMASVSELGDTDRVAVTWFDTRQAVMITAVFDLATGEELTRGLVGDVQSVGTPDADIVSASAGRVARSTADLEPMFSLSKSGVAPNSMQVSGDGRSLLMSGFDNSVSLYDLRDGRRLGDEIDTGWANPWNWSSGYLSEDGQRMVTNTPDGVLLWNLAPERLFEASCRLAGRELTELEWSTYFGDEPQTATCAGVLG